MNPKLASRVSSQLSNRHHAATRLRIVVLGYVVRGPMGGMVMSNLQYLMGLALLGHEVFFLEDSDDYASCYHPALGFTTDPKYGLAFAKAAFARIGFANHWAYYDAHRNTWHGPCADQVNEIFASADVLFNLCGMNPLRPAAQQIPVRVFIDEDPAFTQIRHLTDPAAAGLASMHTAFFSFAGNIGDDCCEVPDDGFPWRTTRQPIVLDSWPLKGGPVDGAFTTVMQWDSYPSREHEGRRYGMKSLSFEALIDLPRKTTAHLELAAAGVPTDMLALLRQKGWRWRDPAKLSRTPSSYQKYLLNSKAEFAFSKHGYVVSHSGWFSERSACYLASGRPVIAQDTGFSAWLPTGTGILSFHTPEEALAGIEAVQGEYRLHCRAAREIADASFNSAAVLSNMIDGIMI